MIWDKWASIANCMREEMKKREAKRDARRRLATVRAAQRRAALPTPKERASALLWSLLDREQRRSIVKNGWFEVNAGDKYIRLIVGNLRPQQVTKDNGQIAMGCSYCIYMYSLDGKLFRQSEWEDHAVGMLLLLRHYTTKFFTTAVVRHDYNTWDQVERYIKQSRIEWRPPKITT